ncbi:hypothetical protein BDZ97DRAFT_1008045 [Flammula alnicola]|nr:hypothetical protein BDZ97DRAFT_1008045 [Flammula alnicola]
MDLSPRQDQRTVNQLHQQQQNNDSASPTLSSHMNTSVAASSPTSNAHLAAMLADSYRDAENLRRELAIARKRVEKADRIHHILSLADASGSPPTTNGGSQDHPQQSIPKPSEQQLKRIIDEYEEKIARAEAARDEAEARRREAQDGWRQLDEYLAALELNAKEARVSFTRTRMVDDANGAFVLPLSSTFLSASASAQLSAHQTMAPPNVPSRHHSRRTSSRAPTVAFPLPPHPNPNPPLTNQPPSTGTRRPRTPSIDGLYSAAQPPSKRSRASADDQRGREPRPSYSESYLPSIQLQHQHSVDREYQEQIRVQQQLQARQHLQRPHAPSQEPRIIDRRYGATTAQYQGHGHRPHSHSHSRSGSHSSASSMDVDEMILKATTGDEAAGGPAPNGRPYLDSPHHQHHLGVPLSQLSTASHRRRSEREADSPRPPTAHPSPPLGTSNNPYPPQQPHPVTAASSYPASQSAPGSMRTVQGSQSHVYTTHVFAPVVTGAPTKKTKFPNTPLPTGGVPGSGPSIDTPQAPAAPPSVPFASTNAQGQRICRQCGMVGRYKDGKCVEKWGPGPMGPGTVCDRCRKKMKRVERRGTLENQQQLANLAIQQQQQQQQQQQHQPRSTSHAQLPLSQGSDRSIHRTDTILTHQASHGPASFRTDRDRDESLHTASSQSQSQSQSQLRGNATTASSSITTASSTAAKLRQQPTPPSIASLREQHDDDDNEPENAHEPDDHDPEQIPTSNVGRGGSSAVKSRSNSSSRNGRARPASGAEGTNGVGGPAKRSPLAGSGAGVRGSGSGSPHNEAPTDEMDADADADAEAEAEAEILGAVDAADEDGDGDGEGDADAEAELFEAVDAAEANSSSSHNGDRTGRRSQTDSWASG